MQSESVSQHAAAVQQSGWAVRMAGAVMARQPRLSIDWRYEAGVVLTALIHLWQKTGDDQYIDYVKANVDAFVEADGSIRTYAIEEYNLDQIDEGKVLFPLYKRTGDERYKLAADLLRKQLEQHPRTSAGGFWHKLIYPHQMWLDGIYMAAPFYAEFGQIFDEPAAYDDVALQISLIDEHTRDAETGLLYHGWDESKSHLWADPRTGRSSSFWGRAIGWYAMALVDVLDYLPEGHPEQGKVIAILEKTVAALASVQDTATGVWYQVIDQGGREGNYLEASASCMIVYAVAKGVRKGYLGNNTLDIAKKGYAGILSEFISVDDRNRPHVNKICSVAGLDQNRNGSFDYYISEKIVTDDYKGIGPFIMASIEMESKM
ncbi:MAG: glycoside hydrolase family 88 protein [Anaerolineae bacterium]|nr:glycoside hydrolase family 88 protein [Anaerolineae bacterium]